MPSKKDKEFKNKIDTHAEKYKKLSSEIEKLQKEREIVLKDTIKLLRQKYDRIYHTECTKYGSYNYYSLDTPNLGDDDTLKVIRNPEDFHYKYAIAEKFDFGKSFKEENDPNRFVGWGD